MKEEGKGRWRRRRLVLIGLCLFVGWILVSHLVVRRSLERWLGDQFEGKPRVAFALLWPHLDVTAWGASVEAEHHRLSASRVSLDTRFLGAFGGRLIDSASIFSLECEVDEGAPLRIFRQGAGEAGPDVDLDPPRVCPLHFHDPVIRFREKDGVRDLFSTGRVELLQEGDLVFGLEASGGDLAGLPFEKLTARLSPRAGHLLFANLKLRAFNGMVAGFLDVDTKRAGALNGELEWRFVEVDRVWRTYGLPFVEKRRGDLSGELVFSAYRPTLRALKGKGTLRLDNAEFYSPLSYKVFFVLKIPVASEAPLNRAEMTFSFEKEIAFIESARAHAREFNLEGKGIITFRGKGDLEVNHGGTTVAVRGSLENPSVKVLPFDHITLPFDRIFRQRLTER